MFYENKHIKNVERISYQDGRSEYLRLDLNENPGGLPAEFVEAALSEITPEIVSQYPEMEPFEQSLAGYLGCRRSNICVVNGSSEGIRFIIEAFTQPGGRIVGVTPSYAMYAVYAEMYGRDFVGIAYSDDLTMSVESILNAITDDTDLVIMLNPNNPIGDAYTNEDMELIVKKAQKCEATLLIDEAYIYFYPNEFLHYALELDHVFITRTFSKLFSLAGLRLGYVVGREDGIKMIRNLCTPHNVNAVAMTFGKKLIESTELIDDLVEKQRIGKNFLIENLANNGYKLSSKEGNFIFIKPKTNPSTLVARMKEEKNILIKTYEGVGELGECLRVTTAEKKYMEVFLNALLELDK